MLAEELITKAIRLGKIYAENDYDPQDADGEIRELALLASPDGVTPEDFEEIKKEIIEAFDRGYASYESV